MNTVSSLDTNPSTNRTTLDAISFNAGAVIREIIAPITKVLTRAVDGVMLATLGDATSIEGAQAQQELVMELDQIALLQVVEHELLFDHDRLAVPSDVVYPQAMVTEQLRMLLLALAVSVPERSQTIGHALRPDLNTVDHLSLAVRAILKAEYSAVRTRLRAFLEMVPELRAVRTEVLAQQLRLMVREHLKSVLLILKENHLADDMEIADLVTCLNERMMSHYLMLPIPAAAWDDLDLDDELDDLPADDAGTGPTAA